MAEMMRQLFGRAQPQLANCSAMTAFCIAGGLDEPGQWAFRSLDRCRDAHARLVCLVKVLIGHSLPLLELAPDRMCRLTSNTWRLLGRSLRDVSDNTR